MFYDKNGNKISLEQFATLSQDMDYGFHLVSELPNGTRISTKWLGIDGCNFETMIFGVGVFHVLFGRCWTEEEAKAMHTEAILEQIGGPP